MTLQLKQIIDSRPDSEPLDLVEVKIGADQATVVLKTVPWWIANHSKEKTLLEITATGLQEVEFYANESRQNIQKCSFSPEDSLLWNYGKFIHVYGKAPLPDPFRFFWEFSELLRKKFDLPRTVQSYLSIKTSLREWEVMCYNRSFLMMTVPEPFLPELSDLFYAQAFEYAVLNDETRTPIEGLSVLRVGHSWIVASEFLVKEG